MNYSEWLQVKFPKLENESSVKIFNYIKKAKSDTKYLRFLVTVISIIIVVLFGYYVGYFFSKFTDLDFGIVIAVSVAVSFLISSQIEKKVERRIVQKKLIELVGKNAKQEH